MEALKRQRTAPPLGPLFAVAEEGAEYEADTLDKVSVQFPLPLPEPFDYRAAPEAGGSCWGIPAPEGAIAAALGACGGAGIGR